MHKLMLAASGLSILALSACATTPGGTQAADARPSTCLMAHQGQLITIHDRCSTDREAYLNRQRSQQALRDFQMRALRSNSIVQ